MAFNPSPAVAKARDIAKEFGKDMVIVYMFDTVNGTVEYASYGETPKKCRAARKIADDVWDEVVAAYEVRA